MLRSVLVYRQHADGTIGVLNVVEITGNIEDARTQAFKLVRGWQATFPGEKISVSDAVNASLCTAVVNTPAIISPKDLGRRHVD